MKFSVSAVIAVCLSSSVAAFTSPSSGRRDVCLSAATLEKADGVQGVAEVDDSATRAKFEKLLQQNDAAEKAAKAEKVEVDWTLDSKKRVQV
jgi:hypothetical protein